MQFSIGHLLFVTCAVSLAFAFFVVHGISNRAQLPELQQELKIAVFQERIALFRANQKPSEYVAVFVAEGMNESGRWIPVSDGIIPAITLKRVWSSADASSDGFSLKSTGESGIVHSIDRFSWINDSTVEVDYQICTGIYRSHGVSGIRYSLIGSQWRKTDDGEGWMQ